MIHPMTTTSDTPGNFYVVKDHSNSRYGYTA